MGDVTVYGILLKKLRYRYKKSVARQMNGCLAPIWVCRKCQPNLGSPCMKVRNFRWSEWDSLEFEYLKKISRRNHSCLTGQALWNLYLAWFVDSSKVLILSPCKPLVKLSSEGIQIQHWWQRQLKSSHTFSFCFQLQTARTLLNPYRISNC